MTVIENLLAAARTNLGTGGRAGPVTLTKGYGDLLGFQNLFFRQSGIEVNHVLSIGSVAFALAIHADSLTGFQVQEGGSHLTHIFEIISALADAVVKKNGQLRVDLVRGVKKYEFFMPPSHELLSYGKCAALFCAQKEPLAFKAASIRIYFVCGEKDEKIKP